MPSERKPSTVGRMISRSTRAIHSGVAKGTGVTEPHAPGVESGVAFSDALVVFRFGENLIVLSVGEHKHRALDARQEFFNHHAT